MTDQPYKQLRRTVAAGARQVTRLHPDHVIIAALVALTCALAVLAELA